MPDKKHLGEPTDRKALVKSLAGLGLNGDLGAGGPPSEVYVMLTMGCNLRCSACSLWGKGGACHEPGFLEARSRPAPLDRVLRFLDGAAKRGAAQVNLTGGEPLLTRRWKPLARHLKSLGLKTTLTTNGTLLERHAEDVAALFDQVSVSVACPPSMREELRTGPKGHWEDMVRGLRSLAGKRSAGGRPKLRLLCEVFDSNVTRLGEVVSSLESEGVVFDEILFQHLIFNRPQTLQEQEKVLRSEFALPMALWRGYGYQPAPMDFVAFDAALADLRRRWPQAVFSVDLRGSAELSRYYSGAREPMGHSWCDGPWKQVNVLPNGDVWVCPDVILGNLGESEFDAIWDGKTARALRRRVAARLLPACRGCFYFYGDGHFSRRLPDA